MLKGHVYTVGKCPLKISKRNTRRDRETGPKSTIQIPEQYNSRQSVATIVNPVAISHPTAVSTFRLLEDKCRHSRYFSALEIKQTNKKKRILTVKQISHSQTKLTHPKFDAKSLHSLQSHPSGSRLLIFLKKSSILFKLFISIEIICRAFEAKNFIEFRLYLLLFIELLKIRLSL